jgi:hypothetical protein
MKTTNLPVRTRLRSPANAERTQHLYPPSSPNCGRVCRAASNATVSAEVRCYDAGLDAVLTIATRSPNPEVKTATTRSSLWCACRGDLLLPERSCNVPVCRVRPVGRRSRWKLFLAHLFLSSVGGCLVHWHGRPAAEPRFRWNKPVGARASVGYAPDTCQYSLILVHNINGLERDNKV